MMNKPIHAPLLFLVLVLCLWSVAEAGPLAYVVNNGSTTLTIIDIGTRQVTGGISVGNQPSELLIFPDNRRALLTENADNALRRIDLRSGSEATAPVGRGPGSLVLSRDTRLAYVANEDSNDVSVVDVATMAVVATILVGTTPVQVNQRPDGRFIYAVNQDSNSISIIDTTTRQVTATVAVGTRPNQFAIHPAGLRAFIPNLGSNTVSVFDLASNSVTRTINVPGREPGIIQFSPDGNRVFVLNRASNSVDIIDNNSLAVIASFTVGAQPTDMALTFDGKFAYVACFGANQVFDVDLSGNLNAPIRVDPIDMGADSRPFSLGFDPDENFVFVVLLGSNQVAVIDTSTDNIVSRLSVGVAPVALVQLNQPFVNRVPSGLVNGASFAANFSVAGGAIVSIFGEGLAAEEGQATSFPIPTTLAGNQMRFNGVAAPLLFVSGLQINAIVPSAVLGASSAVLEIVGPHGSDVLTVSLAGVSPGIFTIPAGGTGPGAITDAVSFALITSSAPARPGQIISIFCTGLGQTNPPIRDGQQASGLNPATGNVSVTVGGRSATIQYAGLAPNFAGLYQVNVTVPDLAAGTHNLTVTVNGVASNTATLAVR